MLEVSNKVSEYKQQLSLWLKLKPTYFKQPLNLKGKGGKGRGGGGGYVANIPSNLTRGRQQGGVGSVGRQLEQEPPPDNITVISTSFLGGQNYSNVVEVTKAEDRHLTLQCTILSIHMSRDFHMTFLPALEIQRGEDIELHQGKHRQATPHSDPW